MDASKIIREIDEEIQLLEQARALLTGTKTKRTKKRWKLSAEGRARIVAAVKRRWAASRKNG